eukprot:CAMPEP_0179004494 /NCGR_PEP_ID=MMETSP0795-20121207/13337_1 /TAXON_ID=88552 /ORGANISM="Amoebophrya sp., Strain Ameob2" /LENGTH=97 /DNA_ID=CAMNT_0020698765 /DNA_START=137 /DNA_END=430 /DNA_ORIENTATION=+
MNGYADDRPLVELDRAGEPKRTFLDDEQADDIVDTTTMGSPPKAESREKTTSSRSGMAAPNSFLLAMVFGKGTKENESLRGTARSRREQVSGFCGCE